MIDGTANHTVASSSSDTVGATSGDIMHQNSSQSSSESSSSSSSQLSPSSVSKCAFSSHFSWVANLPPGSTHWQTVFREAVQTGDTRTLQRILIEKEGKINVNLLDKEGQTALHLCCFRGNLDLVKLLVRFGADVGLANRDGWSSLHIAAYRGHSDIFSFLTSVCGRRS